MDEAENYQTVTRLYTATKWDRVVHPMQAPVIFTYTCAKCKEIAYADEKWPDGAQVHCNVCVSTASAKVEDSASDMTVVHNLPPDLLARLLYIAEQNRLPVSVVIREHLERRYGRKLPEEFHILNSTDQKILTVK